MLTLFSHSLLTSETVMGAEKITAYDSVDADVVQSYLEFSLASLIYYAMKVSKIILDLVILTMAFSGGSLL